MMVTCPSCGSENADYMVYCGKCAAELPRAPDIQKAAPFGKPSIGRRNSPGQAAQPSRLESESEIQSDAQIALAVNVRRIALILMIMLVLTLGGNLLSLWLANANLDIEDAKSSISTWGAASALIVAGGLFYTIFVKRVTRIGFGGIRNRRL